MSLCVEKECTFYAGPTGYCSSHTPEGRERQKVLEEQRQQKAIALRARFDESKSWWASTYRSSRGDKKYLVLGATPHEERRGRTHYSDENVFVLSYEPMQQCTNVDYSRYIQADYSAEAKDELRLVAEKHAGEFDEITFDGSSMCPFSDNVNGTMVHRFQSILVMLKRRGFLYLTEGSDVIVQALHAAGFAEVREMIASDMIGTPILDMLHLTTTSSIILVATTLQAKDAENRS
jgi:hypothetical protein